MVSSLISRRNHNFQVSTRCGKQEKLTRGSSDSLSGSISSTRTTTATTTGALYSSSDTNAPSSAVGGSSSDGCLLEDLSCLFGDLEIAPGAPSIDEEAGGSASTIDEDGLAGVSALAAFPRMLEVPAALDVLQGFQIDGAAAHEEQPPACAWLPARHFADRSLHAEW